MLGSSTGSSGFSFGSNTASNSNTGGLFGTQQSTGPSFGGTSNTTTQQPGGGLFGGNTAQPTPTTGGLFGRTAAAPTATSNNSNLFGSTTGTGTGGSLFGNNATSVGAGSLLKRPSSAGPAPSASGAGGAFGSGGLFGGNQNTGANTGGLFGNKQAGPTSTGGLFGSNTSTGTTTTGGGLFGGSNAASGGTSNTSGLFGTGANNNNNNNNNNNATTTGGGLFGSTTGATTGGGLFGSNNAASTGGQSGSLFGGGAAKPAGGLFSGNNATTSTSGGMFGGSNTTGGGLFGGGASTSNNINSGGLFSKPNNLGGMNSTAPVNPLQGLPLTAMTRVSDLPPQLKQKLEEFDKYVNTQHEIAKVLEQDKTKHNQMIQSIPQDIDYLQNKLLNTSQALNFDQIELVQFKELNYELIDDMNNIQQLIVQLSKPGTKLSSSFQLHEFFLKKIKKFNTVLAEYERLINELNLLLGSLENGFEKGKGNLAQVVLVVKSQYNLFLEVCENMALLHKEISKKVATA